MTSTGYTLLRRDGVAVLLGHPAQGLPHVIHWGADPGPLTREDTAALAAATARQTPPGTLDAAWRPSILPQEAEGWAGRPGLLVTRGGAPIFPRWAVTGLECEDARLVVTARDVAAGLELRWTLQLGEGGMVLVDQDLVNLGAGELDVALLETTLPVPQRAGHVTSFGGRWTKEKIPVTSVLPPGSVNRASRRGRGGHDAPWVTLLSDGEPRNRSGEVWAVHLGWSADIIHRTDRLTEHPTLLGAGELLRPGEIRLAPGASLTTPTAYFAWSDTGLDGIGEQFHRWLRARPQHPSTRRPLVLNTWEAVYFDHDPEVLARLARRAAEIGVERFVLDDGWFPARRDDTAGLGDWVVDRSVWPDGLEPLAELVHGLGMEFGLWFEPEMVNLDSELARKHPEWILGNPASVPSPEGLSFRNQYVLDLANPEACEHVRSQISELVTRLGIDFIKWDHNRDLVEAVHDGAPGVHAQTRAVYGLIERLKWDHPGLEIESCSSGGARTDLGILEHTDRVWASDSNDPFARQDIQRWTELVLPPELIGAHVGPSPAHSSGRPTALSFRIATSLQGSAGFEWNILECSEEELTALRAFAAFYKALRPTLHTGTVSHPECADPALRARAVVAVDRSGAFVTLAALDAPQTALLDRLRVPGLDPERRYRVSEWREVGRAEWGWVTPQWLGDGGATLSGRALETIGLQPPTLWPGQALILHVTSAD